jgi:hypothetical protein
MAGHELVIVDRVAIDGRLVDFPRPLPGLPEYSAAARAEAEAETLRPKLTEDLDERGDLPFQANTPLVFEMRGAAATTVTAAMTGLEAYANHHLSRFETEPGSGVINVAGEHRDLGELRSLPINERYKDVLPTLLDKTKPTSEPWWPTLRRVQGLAALQRHAVYDPQERKGLDGKRSLAERIYTGEYRGAASMMLAAFEHFSPGWVSTDRLEGLNDPTTFAL